ncbi:hypothetical protein Q5P01_008654 [Channa striata]|uniref:Uncharacterized protein n=1 Tax=Channa striata TaxID=64152 RepID=A0AA88N2H6_CHASR|nr:hypothetical protein Q5P01_008654 [Channa striata]
MTHKQLLSSPNAAVVIDVDEAAASEEAQVSECGFEERQPAFNLITNLVLKAERPALPVLITRKPVCTKLKHNGDTGDRVAAHEPFLEANSGLRVVCGLHWLFHLFTASKPSDVAMDFLNHNYLNARSPYDYTFNFWNDYLGLTTLVTKNNKLSMPQNPNSITESLKATLGLDDSPACPCVIAGSVGDSGPLDCCCPSGSPPPASILDLKERFSILSPFQNQLGVQLPEREVGGEHNPSMTLSSWLTVPPSRLFYPTQNNIIHLHSPTPAGRDTGRHVPAETHRTFSGITGNKISRIWELEDAAMLPLMPPTPHAWHSGAGLGWGLGGGRLLDGTYAHMANHSSRAEVLSKGPGSNLTLDCLHRAFQLPVTASHESSVFIDALNDFTSDCRPLLANLQLKFLGALKRHHEVQEECLGICLTV